MKADDLTRSTAMLAVFCALAATLDELAAIGGDRGAVLSAARSMLDGLGVNPASAGAAHVLEELSK